MKETADLIQAVAALLWPILAFISILLFRRQLAALLDRIRKAKLLGQELEVDALGAARSAEVKADAALASASVAHRTQATIDATTPEEALHRLAADYDKARQGPQRLSGSSAEMSQLVGRMIQAATSLSALDVSSAVRSDSPGERLAAYCYVIAHPDATHLRTLIDALERYENTGNGQYWAIQALSNVFPRVGPMERAQAQIALRPLLASFPADSDRGFALRKILGSPSEPESARRQ